MNGRPLRIEVSAELLSLQLTGLHQQKAYSAQKKKVNSPEGAKYFFPVEWGYDGEL